MTESSTKRHAGMFKPGQSGNPLGRPKSDKTLKELAKVYTEDALETLHSIAINEKAKDSARVQAATALLDRGWGKPPQFVEAVNVGMSYEDFLESLPDAVPEPPPEVLRLLDSPSPKALGSGGF